MSADGAADRTLSDLGQLAANLGPVLRPRNDEELLQTIVDTARLVFDAAACSIALLNEDEDTLEFRVTTGAGASSIVGMGMPADRGLADGL